MDSDGDRSLVLEMHTLAPILEVGRELGRGAFADVFAVTHLGLPCAAKRYHIVGRDTENETEKDELDRALKCFEQTCRVLFKLRHPNIVQFMGVYCDDPSTSLPVLVFEEMSTTLTKCIDKYGQLPAQIGYSILKDVAMALCYLHGQSPPVAHKALNANNVLLGRDMLAKLGDVGVSSIVDLHKSDLPGNNIPEGSPSSLCYMPPEAFTVQSTSELSTGSDAFAYGVLVLHVLTGRLPVPDICSSYRGGVSRSMSISEAEFRHDYIADLGDDHHLREMVLHCLSNSPSLRPKMALVLQRVNMAAAVCGRPAYANSVEMLQQLEKDADEQLALREEIRKLSPQSSFDLFHHSNELERLRQTVAKLTAKNRALQEALSARIAGKNGSILSDPGTAKITKRLHRTNKLQNTEAICTPHELLQRRIKWTKCADIPVGMFQAQSIVIGNKVYVGGGNTGDDEADSLIFEYNMGEDSWGILPPVPVTLFGLGQLLGEVVVVGGKVQQSVRDCVYVFDRFTRRWKDSLPPLSTARCVPTCLSLTFGLLVCGGFSDAHKALSSIEMIDCDNFEWKVAGYFSRPATLSYSTAVSDNESVFFLGGYKSSTANSVSNVAHTASLSHISSPTGISPYVWKCLPSTPHFQSTAGLMGGCIVAVGGSSSPYILPVYNSIYVYSSESESWIKIGELPYAACHVTVNSLPTGELLVLGGWVKPGEFKRSYSVYKGSISL